MEIIKLYFDDKILDEAIATSKRIGTLNNSFTGGKSQWVGLLGEYAVKYRYKYLLSDTENIYNNDLTILGKKIEVKSKLHQFQLQDNFEWSIAQTSLHQKPDQYFFVSVQHAKNNENDILNIWLAGYITPKDFFDKAVFYKKGTQHSNGFVSPVNHYNIFQNELNSFINV